MATEREPPPFGDGKPTEFEELEDGEDLFTSTVSTLESSPSSPEPASLPAEDISTNSNGPKPTEILLDDDREDLFAEATEEVSLDSPEREPILSSESTPAITPVTPTTLIAPRMESKTVVAPVDFDRCREEIEEEANGDVFDIEINVSDPEKVGDGMNAYMAYRVTTKTSLTMFHKNEFSVKRRFSDFLGLYGKLASKYLHVGYIVPPAPEKSIVGMTKVKVGKEDSSSTEFVEKRRAALERYLQRTVKHPTLLQDPDLRQFLESSELPRAVNTQALSGAGILRMVNKAADAVNKMTIKMNESDAWFEEKQQQFENLDQQLRKLHGSVEALVCHRKELSVNTAAFAKSAAMLGNSEDHTALSRALSQLAEVEEKIDQLHQEQAFADFYVFAGEKVVCSSLALAHVLPPGALPERTVTLILSNNKISGLKNGSFAGLSLLERLDLKNNLISVIDPGAFLGLTSLKRLDLTNNQIGCLNADIFKGLTNLIRLNLSGNLFSLLAQGTFDHLTSLKALEFQTDYLLCDCNMLWMQQWLQERNITVRDTRCAYPKSLQAQPILSVKQGLLTCDPPLELPSFSMTPSHRQVVFEGDSLPFQCMVSYIDQDMQVLWYQDGKIVETDESQGIFVEKNMIHNCSVIASALTISNIQAGSTGNWGCHVHSRRGNNSKTVDIVVLNSSAQYCPPERVVNNKGDFRWPRTLAGITAYLLCTRYSAGSGIYMGSLQDEKRAWRRCSKGGLWAEEDYSRCQYANDATRVLYMFNQMPLNLTNAVATARQLLAYTVEAANFSDKMDVIFVAEMIEKFGRFAEKYKELGDVMVDIASNIMLADEHILWMAQREAKACTRIVQCLQRIATYRLANGAQVYSTYSPNIAVEAYVIKGSSFTGMTCTVFQKIAATDRTGFSDYGRRDLDGSLDKQLGFKCNVSNTLSSLALKNTVVEASIQLPPALFSQRHKREIRPTENAVYRLQLIAFRNGKLFPSTGNSTTLTADRKRLTVVTPVILTKTDGVSLPYQDVPINVTLRRIAHGTEAVAAQWDFDLLNGQGGWKSDGCHILFSDENVTTIQCFSLSNYAVLMDLTGYAQSADLLHPVIYVSAVILLMCLLMIKISYIYHHSVIRISLKSWHMLINLSFHIFLTCVVFIGGITQSKHASICQAVGIILHYSTLATLLWMGVTSRNIYKQVTRKAKRCQDPGEPPPPPRPMLRFYLIGGGIPVIVCGITAAANIRNYGSKPHSAYCWMAWEPSLGAFYGPAGFIIFVNCMYFLSIFIQLKRHPERKFELKEPSEEQQRLATNEHGSLNNQDSLSVSLVSTTALENEHSFHAQLRGVSLTLFLYVALWILGALSVSSSYPLDLVFSCFFGVLCLCLSSFLIIHHGVNREDVRRSWLTSCCPGRSTYSVQVNVQPSSSAGGPNSDPAKCTNSSAESSCTNKSASSLKNSLQGCKLTNIQVAAAQCPLGIVAPNPGPPLDNSLTEHSVDNEIKMHVAPLEMPLRTNGHPSRHHKNRSKGHRASRLTVLREYAYDVPTSVEGSIQNGLIKTRQSITEGHSRTRRAYLAYRERQYNQSQPDSSDTYSTLQKGHRNTDKTVPPTFKKDTLRKPMVVELEGQQKSYGLNLAVQNGPLKSSTQDGTFLSADSTGNIRTGLWKHETTV